MAAASDWEQASTAYLAMPLAASLLEQGNAYAALRHAEDALVTTVRMARQAADRRRATRLPPLLAAMGGQ